MPRWGRPPAARTGRHNNRGRGFWDDGARVEEIESEEEEDLYGRQVMRDGRGYMRQLEYGGRGPRRRTIDYEDLAEENESVDGGDYDLYDNGDTTVAYAVQLAMRDKEDQLVETALERIRRAQVLGKKNVRLSQRELDALERKRQQTDDPSGARRVTQAGASMNIKPPSKRKSKKPKASEQVAPYPSTPIEPTWGQQGFGQGFGPASGRPSSSSSSAHRPRTPTTQSLRPQQSNSPLRPTYPPFTERFPPNGRPQSMPMHQQPAYSRPLPDDPSWAPPYYHPMQPPMQMNHYPPEQPPYQPQLPSDLRVGPQSRMSYPAGMSPIQAQHRQSPDIARQPMSASHPYSGRQEPESESEVSSDEEEETESSEDEEEEEEDDDEVQVVPVAERPQPPGLQRRNVSGGNQSGRSSRQRRSR